MSRSWASRSSSKTGRARAAIPALRKPPKAPPDGYTLVGGGLRPDGRELTLYKELGYDPEKDFTMISPFVSFTVIITASNTLGINSVQDLIERAKKEPGALNYGSVGIGSSQHLAGEYFAQIAGVKLTHVPYRNIAQFGPDMIAGSGAAWLCLVSECRRPDHSQRRQAARGRRRQAAGGVLPDTPTTTEAGLPRVQG